MEFEISPHNYTFVLRFILNRTVESFGTKFVSKGILAREYAKAVVKFAISILEHHFVRSHSKQFEVLTPSLPTKSILVTEFTKTIVKFGMNTYVHRVSFQQST